MNLLKVLQSKDPDQLLTGQLFFRLMKPAINCAYYDKEYLKDHFKNRDLFSVVGNIAVPKKLLGDEHQYIIAGADLHTMGGIIFGLDQYTGVDFRTRYHGHNLGQILTEPIWRV